MNLGPHWIACLESEGHKAVHWSSVGAGDAPDDDILRWARENDRTILTADLDFGAKLVRDGESRPSVVQLRTADTLVRLVGPHVLAAIRGSHAELTTGGLVTIEDERYRVRRLQPPESL